MSGKLPPLSAIRVFEAAARHLNFTAAAEELAMTQAAVSYQIRLLEERIGARLFLRRARGVELTEAGARLAPAIARGFAELRDGFALLSESAAGVLNISAVPTFAVTWLVPRLGFFQLAHPDIAVRLDTDSSMTDFSAGAVDLGIRHGRGDWPGLVAHKLMDIAFTPMVSPSLATQLGPRPAPADLLAMSLVDPDDPWWLDWFRDAGVEPGDIAARPGLAVASQHLAARAALAGQGAAIVEPAFFGEELASGRLVQPFDLVTRSGDGYWLVYPESRRSSRKIRLFRSWLEERLASEAMEHARAGQA